MYLFFPVYLEVFAFVAEALFVYMYFYTWDKVKPTFHIVIGILTAFGAILSALMIVSVNTLMSVPHGLTPTYDPATGACVFESPTLATLPEKYYWRSYCNAFYVDISLCLSFVQKHRQ